MVILDSMFSYLFLIHFLLKGSVSMERNIIGELKIMKELDIKPNFSALAREYGYDRHTVKKYYDNDGVPKRKSVDKPSKWDPFYDEVETLMNKRNVSKKGVYMYLLNKYGDKIPGTYNGFKSYTLRKGISLKTSAKAHVLYEVEPGKQLHLDWKENLKIHLKDKTEITFNVFTATLGYSREHVFVYSSTKTTDDFIRCMVETVKRLGGVSEEALTDNMSAIVTNNGRNKTVNPRVTQLFKDLNCELRLCKVKTPETKGKDENSNKFVKWIYPYDYALESEDDLIKTIEHTICSQCNQQSNSHTKMPPAMLFKKEKEYLKPIPSKVLLDSYVEEHYRQEVPSTLLVQYKGNKYSVPSDYTGKRVDIYPVGDSIYIYFNKNLITKHNITQNSINYSKNHYYEGLSKNIKSKDVNIEEMAENNLDELKLFTMRDNLSAYIDMISSSEKTAVDALYELTEKEKMVKKDRAIIACIKTAGFPFNKTLNDYDFNFQTSVNKKEIEDFSTLRFIENNENILLIGSPGVGKTHLATAIGIEAAKHRYSVYFISCQDLIVQLKKAEQENRLEQRLKAFTRHKLLIIDEIGYINLDVEAANLFFQFISLRYEQKSTIITTNKNLSKWSDIFCDPVIANAILDRLLHHSHIINIVGPSYRTKDIMESFEE